MDNALPYRVVNIDDTPATRYSITRALTAAGFQVQEAGTGMEGLRLVEGVPDLVLLDIQLPDISGLEVCERIRKNPETASIPVIHISATHISNEDQALGLEGGADAYLIHPVAPSVLVATANAMLRIRRTENALKSALENQKNALEELKVERGLREQFVSSLTHDLRSPLTAARMGAQFLARYSSNPDDIRKHSGRIITNIDRADRMIGDLLDVSRVRAGEKLPLNPSAINLGLLIQEVLDDLTTVHGDRFTFTCAGTINGYWDAQGLRRTVENLCNNAVKYGHPHEAVRVDATLEGEDILISVNNRGNPLSAEELSTLFEPYRRTTGAQASGQKGWGLGLTLVKGFSESQGGSVSVTSNEAEGTTFKVRMPRDLRPLVPGKFPVDER